MKLPRNQPPGFLNAQHCHHIRTLLKRMHHASNSARGSPCEFQLSGAPVQATSAQNPRPIVRLSAQHQSATRTNTKQQSRTSPSESDHLALSMQEQQRHSSRPKDRATTRGRKTTRDEPTSPSTATRSAAMTAQPDVPQQPRATWRPSVGHGPLRLAARLGTTATHEPAARPRHATASPSSGSTRRPNARARAARPTQKPSPRHEGPNNTTAEDSSSAME